MSIFNIFSKGSKPDFSSVLRTAKDEYWDLLRCQAESCATNMDIDRERYKALIDMGFDSSVDAVKLKDKIDKYEKIELTKEEASEALSFVSGLYNTNRSVKHGLYPGLITYDDFDRILKLFNLSSFPIKYYCGKVATALSRSVIEIIVFIMIHKDRGIINKIKGSNGFPVFIKDVNYNPIGLYRDRNRNWQKLAYKYIERHHRILMAHKESSECNLSWDAFDFDMYQMSEYVGLSIPDFALSFSMTGMRLKEGDVLIACHKRFMDLSDSRKTIDEVPKRGFLFQYTPYGVLVWLSFDKGALEEV